MQNKSFSKRIVSASVAMLIVISTAAASIMSGCGSNDNNNATQAVSSTITETNPRKKEPTQITNEDNESSTIEKSESEVESSNTDKAESKVESSNTESKIENSKTESTKAQSNSSSKNDTPSSNTSSSSKNEDNSNSGNANNGVATINGKKYKVGDTVTATYTLKCPEVLVNFQGTVKYDTAILKATNAKLSRPANASSICSYKSTGRILFNGSEISEGYDYTTEGKFLTVTYKVVGSGKTTPTMLWEVATGFDMKTNTPLAENNKPINGLKINEIYR